MDNPAADAQVFQFRPARSGDCYQHMDGCFTIIDWDFQSRPARSGDCNTRPPGSSARPHNTFNPAPHEAGIATEVTSPATIASFDFQSCPARSGGLQQRGSCAVGALSAGLSILPRTKRGLQRTAPNFATRHSTPFNPAPHEAGIATAPADRRKPGERPFNPAPHEAGIATLCDCLISEEACDFQSCPARSGDCNACDFPSAP